MGQVGPKTRWRPEPKMSVAHTAADVLRDHVTLECEAIDRLYLNVYVPHLQTVGAVVGYLRGSKGQRFASTAPVEPAVEPGHPPLDSPLLGSIVKERTGNNGQPGSPPMPKPRKSLISLEATAYYHCVSRCVRRAFLCGEDTHSGRSFEQRLLELAQVFAIEVCGYAIMANHSHGILHVNPSLARSWSMGEVIERWHRLFSGTVLSARYLRGETLLEAEQRVLADMVESWRERLMSVSWLLTQRRCLNEHIARKANEEDECTGRFWKGRFKSQGLLDEQAVLACLAYVDLNPVRAAIAGTPEESDYTSIQRRIQALQAAASHPDGHSSDAKGDNSTPPPTQPPELYPLVGGERQAMPQGLAFHLADYLELVNWTRQAVREDKRGAIAEDPPPILTRLGISAQAWLQLATEFETQFCRWIGQPEHVQDVCLHSRQHWARGIRACRLLFPS
jgi:REP element-mobilizing transposase RayT